MRCRPILALFGLLIAASGCVGSNLTTPSKPMGPEAYCASTFPSVGYGNFFYCGTNQANLQIVPFPDGSHGFCATAHSNLGLVGYIAYTYGGGILFVESQSQASADCNLLGSQCAGYIRCTRQ